MPSDSLSLRRRGRGALSRRLAGAAFLAALGAEALAGTGSLTVRALVPSKNVCKFNGGALVLDFGTINQLSATDATASVTTSFVCNGNAEIATFAVSADDGKFPSGAGARRMRNKTVLTEYMPYALAITPPSGTVAKGLDMTITITGTIQPSQFRNVAAGDYEDRVVITVAP